MIRKQQETRATARIGNGGLLQTDAMVPDKLDLCQAIDDVVGAVCTRKKNFNKSDEVYMLLSVADPGIKTCGASQQKLWDQTIYATVKLH
jgi:hypothetical protein